MIFVDHAGSRRRFEPVVTGTLLQTSVRAACSPMSPAAQTLPFQASYGMRTGAARMMS